MLTHADLGILPRPKSEDLNCTFLKDDLCAEFSKDPLTLVTNAWGTLQLTWTVMLLFVHLFQVAKNLTTFESMRNTDQVNPILSAMTTGTMSLDSAQVTGAGAETLDGHGHMHTHRM
jgi:protein AFG1